MQSSSQIITTNKPTSSFFYRPDALRVTQPTVSKHWSETLYRNIICTNAHNKQQLLMDIDISVPSTPNFGDLFPPSPRNQHPWVRSCFFFQHNTFSWSLHCIKSLQITSLRSQTLLVKVSPSDHDVTSELFLSPTRVFAHVMTPDGQINSSNEWQNINEICSQLSKQWPIEQQMFLVDHSVR